MSWLFDQPLYIVLCGIAVLVPLAVLWISSGRKELLYILGVGLVILAALLVVERLVVSDREAIDQAIHRLARAVEKNDVPGATGFFHSSAAALKRKAQAEMPNYRFTRCQITQVHKIEVASSVQPPTAVVEFNVVVGGSFKLAGAGEYSTDNAGRWIQLQMRKEPTGEWRVTDYDHREPTAGYFDRDPTKGFRP